MGRLPEGERAPIGKVPPEEPPGPDAESDRAARELTVLVLLPIIVAIGVALLAQADEPAQLVNGFAAPASWYHRHPILTGIAAGLSAWFWARLTVFILRVERYLR